jgi:hypothetical protein
MNQDWSDAANRKLLFVFYDRYACESFKSHFSILGYQVLTAKTLAQARELCTNEQPRVIVCQDRVDDGTGHGDSIEALLTFVERALPQARVIMTTVLVRPDLVNRIKEKLFAILSKPTTFEMMTRVIERAFGRAGLQYGDDMLVRPLWRGRNIPFAQRYCFVLMPFLEPWSARIWVRHLKPIIDRCGFRAERADDFTGHDVMEDIWNGLNKAEVVLADITARNPNVFYELGIAHTLGKNVVLITQNISQTPFDVHRYRVIEYQDNSDGYEHLDRALTRFFRVLAHDGSDALNVTWPPRSQEGSDN